MIILNFFLFYFFVIHNILRINTQIKIWSHVVDKIVHKYKVFMDGKCYLWKFSNFLIQYLLVFDKRIKVRYGSLKFAMTLFMIFIFNVEFKDLLLCKYVDLICVYIFNKYLLNIGNIGAAPCVSCILVSVNKINPVVFHQYRIRVVID